MQIVIGFLSVLAFLAVGYAADRWNRRPSARARWAALGLREKIDRTIRLRRIAIAILAGFLVLFTALWPAGQASLSGWLISMAIDSLYLGTNLYLLRCALAARRAYDSLGPLAYLAEVRHAFGTRQSAQTPDVTAHNLRMLPGTRPADSG